MKATNSSCTSPAAMALVNRRLVLPSGACQSGSVTRPTLQCSRRAVSMCAVAEGATADTKTPDIEAVVLRSGVVDYYSVLQVDDDASDSEIKSAYRQLAKVCHPDNAGDKGHNICILLNEAYTTLSNAKARQAYDKQLEVALKDHEDGYTGEALSKWIPGIRGGKMSRAEDPNESRAVFVDENKCIGCKNCVWCAPATFRMEPVSGRSRVFAQWLNTEEELDTAIMSCPVDCIHWVDRSELPALEHVCQKMQTLPMWHELRTACLVDTCELHAFEHAYQKVQSRTNIAVMMGQGSGGAGDVFDMRDAFLKERKKLDERRKKAEGPSPMQEAARQAAAEALARERGGWLGQVGYRMAQGFASAAAGAAAGERAGSQARPGARVGQRKRAVRWNDQVATGRGGTIPHERALVPVMSKVEDF